MKLEGMHHITMITADAQKNVAFYAERLGLRMVKKTGWQQRVREAGGFVTDVRDRDDFDAIYFREPRGILFEMATLSPGVAADEEPERLGEELRVPKMHAARRDELERTLTPVVDPRTTQREAATA